MKQFVVRYRKVWFCLFLFTICLHLAACSTAWTGEASNIITMLVPAIEAALGILTAFGLGLPTNTLTAVQNWSQQAQNALLQVKALIDKYNAALPAAQPGILVEIQTILSTVSSSLGTILPTLHVTDPTTQAKIEAVFASVMDEVNALIGLIPVVQGAVTDHDEARALYDKLKSAKAFKKDFNEKVASFGASYQLK